MRIIKNTISMAYDWLSCIHALSTLLHYIVALDEGADPVKLGLSRYKGHAYMQCVDPGAPYTDGGSVIFECRRSEGPGG